MQAKRSLDHQRAAQIQERYGKELPEEAVQVILAAEFGHERFQMHRSHLRRSVMSHWRGGSVMAKSSSTIGDDACGSQHLFNPRAVIFGFKEEKHLVLECAGTVALKVVASRAPEREAEIRYFTREGSAKHGVRYEHVEGSLTFAPQQREAWVSVPIIDNNDWDPEEEFYVCLEDPHFTDSISTLRASRSSKRRMSTAQSGFLTGEFRLGQNQTIVTVLNDDMPGILGFDADELQASQGSTATIGVLRTGGSSGRVSCEYATKDVDAKENEDYFPTRGTLVLEDGEVHRTIQVRLPLTREAEEDLSFQLRLFNASPGVKFDLNSEGGELQAICDIVILATRRPSLRRRLDRRAFSADQWRHGAIAWREQFVSALYCNGSPEDQIEASRTDWFFHCR